MPVAGKTAPGVNSPMKGYGFEPTMQEAQLSPQRLSELLQTLYAAPARSELWPVFLQDFSSLLDGDLG